MEHRFGTRRPARIPAVVRDGSLTPLRGFTRNVSLSGLFVEVGVAGLALNQVVDVELTVPGYAGLETRRFPAMIVRLTPTGIALLLDRLPPKIVRRALAAMDNDLPVLAG